MALALTQIYLEPEQKKSLAARAKAIGRKPSEAIRDAIDAYVAGVTIDDLKLLDVATKKAEKDLKEMVKVLDAGQKRSNAFFAEIEKIKAASAKVSL
jgi:predicted DNA-binding protein